MSTDIDICNEGLLYVGANQISAFTDSAREAEVSAALYPTARDGLLQANPWFFTLKKVELARTTVTPEFDYSYQYQLPTDMLRFIRKNTPRNDYQLFEDKLETNDSSVQVIYQYDPGESNYPAYFSGALSMEMAKRYSAALLQDDTQIKIWEALAAKELIRAKNIDAQHNPPFAIPANEFPLTAVR